MSVDPGLGSRAAESTAAAAATAAAGPLDPVTVLNGTAHVLVVAFVVALVTTPLVRRVAFARGIVDRPDEARKIHRRTTPYLGGVAVFLGILAAVIVSWTLPGLSTAYRGVPIGVIVGMVAMALVGLADDAGGWDPRTKIAGQLVAAAGLAIEDIGTQVAVGVLQPIIGKPEDPLFMLLGEQFANADAMYWVGVAVIAIFVLGASNSANFIDGLDGLLSGQTAIFALGVLVISLMLVTTYPTVPDEEGPATAPPLAALVTGRTIPDRAPPGAAPTARADLPDASDLPGGGAEDGARTADPEGPWIRKRASPNDLPIARVVLALAVLGAVLGFLPWNFNPAVIFLGDCGSLMLGYLGAVLILMLGDRGQTHFVVAGLIVFSLPIMDAMLAIVRRKLAGVSMSAADSDHIHHMVKRAAGSVRRAVLVLYVVCALFAVLGVALTALVLAQLQARAIYAVAIVLFGFIGVLAVKTARLRQLQGPADGPVTSDEPPAADDAP